MLARVIAVRFCVCQEFLCPKSNRRRHEPSLHSFIIGTWLSALALSGLALVKQVGDVVMPTFHFAVRDGGRVKADPDGMELPDTTAAHEHAREVARELMTHSER